MSVLSDFCSENGITIEAIIGASKALEKYTSKDRPLLVQRATARRNKKKYDELELGKPAHFGRGISTGNLQRAFAGRPIPRIARKKIIRAVNACRKGTDSVDARALFSDAGSKKGEAKK